MGNALKYCFSYFTEGVCQFFRNLFKKEKNLSSFNGHKNITVEYGGKVLSEFLINKKPFAAVRLGSTETSSYNNYLKIKHGFIKDYPKRVAEAMKIYSGFYPNNKESLNMFGERIDAVLKNSDIYGRLGSFMEDYIIKLHCPKIIAIQNKSIDPLRGLWTKDLIGKKVLVVSPFSEQIISQYRNRKHIFPEESKILPEFTLLTYSSPMTLGSSYVENETFFSLLDKMVNDIKKIDFEVALVGCGAYGTLLCLEIKSMGKSAIQTAGATQLLFGLFGKRWENYDYVKKYVNEWWRRPDTKPQGFQKIENGCYW